MDTKTRVSGDEGRVQTVNGLGAIGAVPFSCRSFSGRLCKRKERNRELALAGTVSATDNGISSIIYHVSSQQSVDRKFVLIHHNVQ